MLDAKFFLHDENVVAQLPGLLAVSNIDGQFMGSRFVLHIDPEEGDESVGFVLPKVREKSDCSTEKSSLHTGLNIVGRDLHDDDLALLPAILSIDAFGGRQRAGEEVNGKDTADQQHSHQQAAVQCQTL